MLKGSLKLVVCCICATGAAPVFAKEAVKHDVVHSDQWKRHSAIEEIIGRVQLDNLIASMVDADGRPIKLQQASRVTFNPAGQPATVHARPDRAASL